ncbi:MAG: hypothetical protein EWV49_20885 [Microcystis aeruginosa Ma_QC_Ch_20071001_S25]|jgi:hypothetical protein|uniref:Uncharacterized protein n=2 Tax=Microcystis aeruginosa TaxID=1126 RepID=A0A552G600_MICAE|nr:MULTISPECIES: hypothetical protein [unclassified Microcystis]MCA2761628.1 hypothetical protein [Microcystis sp. M151S2]MCA2927174.1 hypothetical protein [Microcystis sp. M020S1]MCA2934380.1 hypothetical protein [Microcystis sp. M015S1]MCZ8307463.1 hypothetical protein [Microcystis sp. LE19-98.1E]NCQ85173.1 hypothetical protein [Microcystis aeruginosa W13-18]NCR35045.1 hypothetical protein [Microcystis aeruginosa S11-05]NCR48500.1 hypothetical protein [Microcystis aeruginosa S11-01]NCR596
MNSPLPGDNSQLDSQLHSLVTTVTAIAQEQQGDCNGLLMLLRTLENLHRQIREQMFEPSLPNTRKDLYGLLRDIEETGGWPYIERMKLQMLMEKLLASEVGALDSAAKTDDREK